MNINFNLGSYWTDTGHIIGNARQLADFLSVKSMFDPTLQEKNCQMGYQISSFVASVRKGLSDSLDFPVIERHPKSVKIYY